MRKGTELFERLRRNVGATRYDSEEYADRIIFLTDAMPNTGRQEKKR